MLIDTNVLVEDEDPDNFFSIQNVCRLAVDLFAGSEDLSVASRVDILTTEEKMSVDDVAKFAWEREEGEDVVVESCHVCCLLNDCNDLCRRQGR